MKVTLRDIAEKAGVSISTVSRVINDDQETPVNEETKKLVWQLVKDMGYSKYNGSSKRSSKKIGYILNNTSNIFNHPYFSVLLDAIETEIKSQGYSVGFSFVESDIKKESVRHQIINDDVDGLILIANFIDEEFAEQINENYKNIVSIDFVSDNFNNDLILIEKKKAAYNAVRYLIEHGHEEIAYIGGGFVGGQGMKKSHRYLGYKKAMDEKNLIINEQWVRNGDWSLEGGYLQMMEIIKAEKIPTAVYTASDLMAIGVFRAIQQSGLTVPDDISVISYDNIEMSKYSNPPLTTFHVPKREIGKLAVKLLLDQINDQNPGFPLKIMVSAELVERESVAKIK
ncbi:LacI family DNA-binding transcriptional regulator [Iocasia frigidifontis]|uniref:LacI family DNA-binding transcriptional regulator n=1 Tax=Iocasia fonsfrigidae TaxID=2682810 RepID=A0A8A7KAA4_9FIRM|nr:LacI family DNA-binding transcriptional regulator [Iocasia fonsfrigidae]QTL97025.1 LacI family DNA-binding transcriptional regulator [Iocasia fonsfrigidae]